MLIFFILTHESFLPFFFQAFIWASLKSSNFTEERTKNDHQFCDLRQLAKFSKPMFYNYFETSFFIFRQRLLFFGWITIHKITKSRITIYIAESPAVKPFILLPKCKFHYHFNKLFNKLDIFRENHSLNDIDFSRILLLFFTACGALCFNNFYEIIL